MEYISSFWGGNEDDKKLNIDDAGKKLGGYIYSFANHVKNTASDASKLLDDTVFHEFNLQQDKFASELKSTTDNSESVPPWDGLEDEAEIKSKILNLSLDERNFLRDPPDGCEFQFFLEQNTSTALLLLKIDENLSAKRYSLVPKRVNEHRFWRNYFYRISLIKQAAQSLSKSSSKFDLNSSDTINQNEDFASDSFQSNSAQVEEMKKEIKLLEGSNKADIDLEEELQKEIDFEMLEETDCKEWEQELDDMLSQDDK